MTETKPTLEENYYFQRRSNLTGFNEFRIQHFTSKQIRNRAVPPHFFEFYFYIFSLSSNFIFYLNKISTNLLEVVDEF
jgi:hypothetical protein